MGQMGRRIDKIERELEHAVEYRARPALDDVDAANILSELRQLRTEIEQWRDRCRSQRERCASVARRMNAPEVAGVIGGLPDVS